MDLSGLFERGGGRVAWGLVPICRGVRPAARGHEQRGARVAAYGFLVRASRGGER